MLQDSRGVFFLRVLKRRRQRNTHAPCWETINLQKDNNIYKQSTRKVKDIRYMLQNSRGVFFLRVLKRRRQRNAHAPYWETPKTDKKILKAIKKQPKSVKINTNRYISTKYTRYMLQNSRGVFFLRSPKRRRQPPPVAQCWGT